MFRHAHGAMGSFPSLANSDNNKKSTLAIGGRISSSATTIILVGVNSAIVSSLEASEAARVETPKRGKEYGERERVVGVGREEVRPIIILPDEDLRTIAFSALDSPPLPQRLQVTALCDAAPSQPVVQSTAPLSSRFPECLALRN